LYNSVFYKDLSLLKNRNLKDIILVDNSCTCFSLNLENGVPIVPFYNDKSDEELLALIEFLIPLAQVDDVR